MTITIFVEPKSLMILIEVLSKLKNLEPDNNYTFQPKDLIFSEEMISNFIWLNVPIEEYLKLKLAMNRLTKK